MFLDFGLTQGQFAQLNFAWAIAIVLLEVPSGALADQFGRKKLVVCAAVLMMIEMLIMLLMPVAAPVLFPDDPVGLQRAVWLLFGVFLVNRVISGAAEAAASGADEALAYDSLPETDRDATWSKLMSQLMMWQSIAFIVVTIVGAAAYDAKFLNSLIAKLGIDFTFQAHQALKLPILFTLGMSIGALVVALKMKENSPVQVDKSLSLKNSIRENFARTFAAGKWILATPAALMLILVGLSFDSIIRLYYTVGSIWLKVIGYEPVQFGMISVAGSITGILAAVMSKRLVDKRSPNYNFRTLIIMVFLGILSLAFPIKYWSVIFLPFLWLSMRFLHFILSTYLHRVTPSESRATVLSFRGLTMNLAYGLLTMLYASQVSILRKTEATNDDLVLFAAAAKWWWVYLLFLIAGLIAYRQFKIGKDWNQLFRK